MKASASLCCFLAGAILSATVGAADEVGDLALAGVVPPRLVVLSAEAPRVTRPVLVIVENRGTQQAVIPDPGTLAGLVSIKVESLGKLPAPEAALTSPRLFPKVLRPGGKMLVVFSVTFAGANDPARSTASEAHDDFHFTASIHPSALGSTLDADASNDSLGGNEDTDVVLEPSFFSATPAVTSSSALANNESETTEQKMSSTARSARAAVFHSLTAKPTIVPIKKGKTVSEPIVFTAKYSGTASGLSWSPGTAVPPYVYKGNTFKCQWNTGGSHTVKAYLFDGTSSPPHKEVTIKVVKVELQNDSGGDPNGMKVGVSTSTKDRSRMLKAIVDPASEAGSVGARVKTGGSRLRASVAGVSGGTVDIKIEGIGTTGSLKENDTTVEITLDGQPVDSANVTVIVPAKIKKQVIVARDDHNFLAYESNGRQPGSSPAVRGAPVYPMARLMTFYGFKVEVEVTDRFNNPIDDPELYLGAPVAEDFGGGLVASINQNIRNGSVYIDPTGTPGVDFNPGRPPVHVNSTVAHNFLNAPPLFPVAPSLRNPPLIGNIELAGGSFIVQIDGFPLTPKISRVFRFFQNNHIELEQTP